MAKTNNDLRENTKKVLREQEIKKEVSRLKKMYKDLPKDNLKGIEGLINEAAFIRVTLQESKETLLQEGTTEMFEQGSQSFLRKHPAVDVYATFMSKYIPTMKQLIDLIPDSGAKKTENDKLMNFVQRGQRK